MNLPLELFISLRYMKARKRYAFISLSTFLSIVSVTVGVMIMVVVLSVMSGFERDLRDKILGAYAHLEVESLEKRIEDYEALTARIETTPHIEGVSPYITAPVQLIAHRRTQGVILRGYDAARERRTSNLLAHLKCGRLNADGAVVGWEMFRRMGLSIGDTVELISPAKLPTPFGFQPRTLRVPVTGVFRYGHNEYDTSLVYLPLAKAQWLLGLRNAVQGLSLRVDAMKNLETSQKLLNASLGLPYIVRSWQEKYPTLFAAIRMERKVMAVILVFIIVVAALNIVSTLVMVVMEKTRDIGILKSIGVGSGSVLIIFTLEGFIIGMVGAVLGTTIGLLLNHNINLVAAAIERLTGFYPFPSNIYILDKIPTQISAPLVVFIAAAAVLISTLFALYPASRAARLNPVEALRYE